MSKHRFSRLLVAFLLVVLVVPMAEAQRRRSVRASNPSTSPPPAGNCHTFGFVNPGTKGTYLTTTPQGNVNFTITWIYDNATQTKTTQQVTTAQGSADVETILDSEVVGPLRGLEHTNIKTSTTVPFLGKLTTEVDITMVPSLVLGPSGGWCTGATWNVSPVTETVVTKPPQGSPITTIVTTVGGTGEVLAVGEMITVPAGTFKTVKHRNHLLANDTVSPAITWMSMDHNIPVKQDTLDANGNVTTVTELQSLQQ